MRIPWPHEFWAKEPDTMKSKIILLFTGLITLAAATAHASGLPMAESWSWARDGGRIINSVVVLSAVVWLIKKYGAPILRNRAKSIAEEIASLEKSRADTEKSLKESAERLEKIETEARRIQNESKADGELIKKQIIEQAEESAKKIVEKAAGQIALETDQAKEKIFRETMVAAIELAEKTIRQKLGPDDQKRIVKDFFDKMENAN